MTNVFENPWLMLTLAAISIIPVYFVRQAKPEWGYRPLLIPILLAALGFGLDYAVQTDSEKIHAIIRTCRQAAVTGDIAPIEEVLCDNYDDGFHRGREDFLNSARRAISQAAVSRVRFQTMELTLEGQRAVMELDAVVHLDPQSQYAAYGSLVFVSLRVEFAKLPTDQWCIRGVGITSVNNQRVNWGAVR